LKDGYFDSEGHLRPEVVGHVAQKVAETIRSERVGGREPMGYGQLRSFWSLTQAIRNKLGLEGSFAEVKADIKQLSAKAAYAVGRGVVPPVFKDFIDRNVELALQSPEAFRKGFVRHFEAVIAFSRYAEYRQKAAQDAARR
jgi:CRISPR type III-A-associated protein Csm2